MDLNLFHTVREGEPSSSRILVVVFTHESGSRVNRGDSSCLSAFSGWTHITPITPISTARYFRGTITKRQDGIPHVATTRSICQHLICFGKLYAPHATLVLVLISPYLRCLQKAIPVVYYSMSSTALFNAQSSQFCFVHFCLHDD